MKKSIYARASLLQESENDFSSLILTFVVSLVCHVIFFVALVFIPGLTQQKKFLPSVVNVSLVTLPPQRKAPSPGKQIKKEVYKQVKKPKKKSPKKSVKVDRKSPKAVSVVPKEKKVKISLKKKTFDSSKVVKSAIKKIEKKVEKTRRDQLAEAMERLKDKVEKTEAIERLKEKTENDAPKPDAKIPPVSRIPNEMVKTGEGKEIADLIQIYKIEIAYQVQKNWAFSEQLAGVRTDLKALLVFKVMPDGEIRDVFFTDRSGNRYLDESAHKAIIKSNPVLPHPKGIIKPYVTVGLRFTPEGVK